MLILGFTGGADLVQENLYRFTPGTLHDSACALIEDGKVLFAIEEERLNRIKHTNKFPCQSMRSCLAARRVRLSDIDLIAYNNSKEGVDDFGKTLFLRNLRAPELSDGAALIQSVISRALNNKVDKSKIRFVHHHYAHATSAFALSGFDSCLILTIDGIGEKSSGMVMVGEGTALRQIADFPLSKSLGKFYVNAINYLGFKQFDEYKVMGLAPYGDPARHRELFQTMYTLLPQGEYSLHADKLPLLFDVVGRRRAKDDPLTQVHKDIAAAIQETLEEIVFHVVRHHQELTKQKNLCLAGGVAQNCTLNGKLLRSGLFENVFVQPAAHDAGAAVGSALYAYYQERPTAKRAPQIEDVYWGTDIGGSQSILRQLTRWEGLLSIKKSEDICVETAELLANGNVVGWVQGRSEFGPRALGNRSILADPRPPGNKDRINQMVKKREAYRPFAPSVLEEYYGEFFDIKAGQKTFPFMIFTVDVRDDKRSVLAAVTHVDGTARVQTVSRKTNQSYWRLIYEFKKITGVPILLNTSFNNNVEPIVDSIEDAVVCYLTTQLDCLIVGDYLLKKKEASWQDYLSLKPVLSPYMVLLQQRKLGPNGSYATSSFLRNTYDEQFQHGLSSEIYRILSLADGERSLKNIIDELGETDERRIQEVVLELIDIWAQRFVILRPAE